MKESINLRFGEVSKQLEQLTARQLQLQQAGILEIRIHDQLYPIDEGVLHQVFDSFGSVTKIEVLEGVFMLYLESFLSAYSAATYRNGRCIYAGCCVLDIKLYKLQLETNGLKDNETNSEGDNHDFSST